MEFLQTYRQLLDDSKFLSKFSSFLIASIAFLEIANNLWNYYVIPIERNVGKCSIVGFSVGFQTTIAVIFALRFIFLWQKNSKFLWFSQITWLFGWVSLYLYQFLTRNYIYGSFLTGDRSYCVNEYYFLEIFVIASIPLTLILGAYFILSPIKLISFLLFSFINRK